MKRSTMRHPPCSVECGCDGNQVYACIGRPDEALRGEAGVIAFGDTLADALRNLGDEIVREVVDERASVQIQRVFAHLKGLDCAIVGSAVSSYPTAHDIDVLVRATFDVKAFFAERGLVFLGGFTDKTGTHVRRCKHFTVPGVSKPVQILQWDTVERFEDYPHEVLLRDGTLLHAGVTFTKQRQ